MKNIYIKNKKELALWLAAVILSVLVLLYIYSSIKFLVTSFNKILDTKFISELEIIRFNLKGVNELKKAKGIIK